jgi:hypothetical protein
VARGQPDGTLTYTFVEIVKATFPFYVIRLLGGLLYLGGMLIMLWNTWMTAISGQASRRARSPPPPPTPERTPNHGKQPWAFPREDRDQQLPDDRADPAGLLVGGLVEIVPLFFQKSTTEPVKGLKPYTALQLAGRDVYIREGCYNCHSQMIRPFRAETLRYGHYSVAGEFVYDHPFQWGSKRTGPDLAPRGRQVQRRMAPHPPDQPA